MLFQAETLQGAIKKATYGLKRPKTGAVTSYRSTNVGEKPPQRPAKQNTEFYTGTSHGNQGNTVTYRDPASSERTQINSAFRLATTITGSAFRYISRNGRDDVFTRFFGTPRFGLETQVATVRTEITATRNEIVSKDSQKFGVAVGNDGTIIAEILIDNTMVFYPRFFRRTSRAQALTIVHECIHLATDRRDIQGGYSLSAVENLAQQNSANAMLNVASLALYIDTVSQ